jgi:hypothetical protein
MIIILKLMLSFLMYSYTGLFLLLFRCDKIARLAKEKYLSLISNICEVTQAQTRDNIMQVNNRVDM